ncbi:hypothetical protein NLI96_g11459 [Meripilus lineatus]|uniref:Transposase n=1 Tax=Meripilus lineatus TaxID=2056292 RepID=A0AAD5Y944_9APHY|nr:hypothetical protein NLI96_g11459 [Physisporinus lineatus]
MIVEFRPSMSAGRLAEHLKQLHLREYKQRMMEYLRYFQARSQQKSADSARLFPFSAPDDVDGYNDQTISSDMVSEVYQEFYERSRQEESIKHTRTLTGECISTDATFKAPKRGAVVVNREGKRYNVGRGGILSIINERSEIIAWHLCQTKEGEELTEILDALRARYSLLGVDLPWGVISDDCCKSRSSILLALSDTSVFLDIFHCIARYTAVILGGCKNRLRGIVSRDIRDSLLKEGATPERPALYWSKEEQGVKLEAVFQKWSRRGGVWSAAAPKVHVNQMLHVRQGCLTRPNQHIRSDGSRIEGVNRHWNTVVKAVSSGLENFLALSYDFVLRKNIRTAMRNSRGERSDFVDSTFGSHYIGLVDDVAKLWNLLYEESKAKGREALGDEKFLPLPELQDIPSGEVFGLVPSANMASFSGNIKVEDEEDEPVISADDPASPNTEISQEAILKSLDIDPQLLLIPLESGTGDKTAAPEQSLRDVDTWSCHGPDPILHKDGAIIDAQAASSSSQSDVRHGSDVPVVDLTGDNPDCDQAAQDTICGDANLPNAASNGRWLRGCRELPDKAVEDNRQWKTYQEVARWAPTPGT